MMAVRLLPLAVIGALLLSSTAALAQPPREKPAKKVLVVLPDDHEVVKQRVTGTAYETHVDINRSLLTDPKLEIQLSSRDPGEWRTQRFRVGKLVEGAAKLEELAKQPRPDKPLVCEFKLNYKVDPQAPKVIYEQQIEPFEDAADKEFSRTTEAGAWRGALRKNLALHLKKLNEKGVPGLKELDTPKFLAVPGNPEGTLNDLSVWIALDRLLVELPIKRKPNVTERETLELWNEMIGVMYGTMKAPRDLRSLPQEEFENVAMAGRVHLELSFLPWVSEKKPDRNWSLAPKVQFGPGLTAARWQGKVGAGQRTSEWLAVKPVNAATKLRVESEQDSQQIVWSRVEGEQGWQYLRVMSVDEKSAVDFKLVVRGADGEAAPEIEVRVPPPSQLRFPY